MDYQKPHAQHGESEPEDTIGASARQYYGCRHLTYHNIASHEAPYMSQVYLPTLRVGFLIIHGPPGLFGHLSFVLHTLGNTLKSGC